MRVPARLLWVFVEKIASKIGASRRHRRLTARPSKTYATDYKTAADATASNAIKGRKIDFRRVTHNGYITQQTEIFKKYRY
jgi:hypothetical protein